jgi:hypothetical protein
VWCVGCSNSGSGGQVERQQLQILELQRQMSLAGRGRMAGPLDPSAPLVTQVGRERRGERERVGRTEHQGEVGVVAELSSACCCCGHELLLLLLFHAPAAAAAVSALLLMLPPCCFGTSSTTSSPVVLFASRLPNSATSA